jgi:HTH-type transcriptional regulator/antitoxin HigA
MSHLVAVRPIRTEEDFDAAVERITDLMPAEEGTREFDELQVLASLVTEYERRVRPVPDATPVEILRFVMEDRGLTESDLALYFGTEPSLAEFLSGERELTVQQIRRLGTNLGIPAAALIGSSEPLSSPPGP